MIWAHHIWATPKAASRSVRRASRASASSVRGATRSLCRPRAADVFGRRRAASAPRPWASRRCRCCGWRRASSSSAPIPTARPCRTTSDSPGPCDKRQDAYCGDRSLFTEDAERSDRRQLVGLRALDDRVLPPGAHAVVTDGQGRRSIGFVTSSAMSPVLGAPRGARPCREWPGPSRRGAGRRAFRLQRAGGSRHRAEVVAPCAFDPDGARLHA